MIINEFIYQIITINIGAPQLRKFGYLSIRENLVMASAYNLPSAQTVGEGDGVRSHPSEEEYVIAEVKHNIIYL